MAATGNTTIRLMRPTEELVGTDHLELEGDHVQVAILRAWMTPIRAERALHSIGALTDRAYKCRFRAPHGFGYTVTAGWRIEDENDEEYEVRTATEMRGLWNLVVERV